MRHIKRISMDFSLFLLMVAASVTALSAAGQQPYRVRTNAVPVDVTVLDDKGNPILGLTAADFEVLENGVPQKLDFFLAPEPSQAASGVTVPNASPNESTRPRYFLFLLGNMGFDEFDSIPSIADFVEKLGPNDLVALMAFGRVGEFTNDHQKTAAAIRSYAAVNAEINAQLRVYRERFQSFINPPPESPSPLSFRSAYDGGSPDPQAVRKFFIDNGFRSLQLPRGTFEGFNLKLEDRAKLDLNSLETLWTSPRDDETRDYTRMHLLPGLGREAAYAFDPVQISLLDAQRFTWSGDVTLASVTSLDYSQIVAGIEHLSFLDGDKHLFFFNDIGLGAPGDQVSRFAASSRVRLHMFQTGGVAESFLVVGDYPGKPRFSPRGAPDFGLYPNTYRLFGPYRQDNSLALNMAASTFTPLARKTGGTASIHALVEKTLPEALRAIDATYRLAYAPKDTDWNGRYREIEVRVKRDGATPLYRRGYWGDEPPTERERLDNLILTRTVAAFRQPEYVKDIPLDLTLAQPLDQKDSGLYEVRLKARFTEETFPKSNGSRKGELAIAYFLVRGGDVAVVQDKIDLALTEQEYQTALSDGFHFKRQLPIPKKLAGGLLKAVVYQPDRDLLGSVDLKLPE